MGIINHCSLGCESAGEESVGEVTHMVKLTLSSSWGHLFFFSFCTTEKVFIGHLRWQPASLGIGWANRKGWTGQTTGFFYHLISEVTHLLYCQLLDVSARSRPQCRWENRTRARMRSGRSLRAILNAVCFLTPRLHTAVTCRAYSLPKPPKDLLDCRLVTEPCS